MNKRQKQLKRPSVDEQIRKKKPYIHTMGRSPGEKAFPLPVFSPGEFRGLYGVTKSRTTMGNFHFQIYTMEF